MSLDSMIIAKEVYKEYRKGKTVIQAVKNVSLEIKSGEMFFIVGPSGCGKSTLINVLSGLDQPSGGRVIFDGMDTSQVSERDFPKMRREKLGFIFQEFNLLDDLTAIENVEAPLWPVRDVKSREREDRAIDLLRSVDLLSRKDHRPNHLSGGEQQRVAIARALINNPKVVFADEPTGNLDSKIGSEIFNLLKELQERKKTTFVVVTHNDAWPKKYADRVATMKDGVVTGISEA
jgi:putative ABC transport system ATP-binding protein